MRITPLTASRFRSDGGAMFGLVPKPIWSKLIPANEHNGIPQHANALLIELDDGRTGLVDCGCGDPAALSDKELGIHGMTRDWPLRDALREVGVAFEAIDFVVLTHLHWDHAGGLTAGGAPCFPNAEHILHAIEHEDALGGNPLLHKSYPPSVAASLQELENLRLVEEDEQEVLPGIRLSRTGGHTRGHCCVDLSAPVIRSRGGERPCARALFAGDVCPTRHHLRMVYQTAYDTFPLETRAWKRSRLAELAAQADAWLLFCHDPDVYGARISADPKQEFAVEEVVEAAA